MLSAFLKPLTPPKTSPKHFVIFCQVIDNYGDIGVCWRLAKQLSQELGQRVTLWVDNLASLHAICPEINTAQSQQCCAGIDVNHWQAGCETGSPITHSNTVVIEAFGCNIPTEAIDAIKHHGCQWLNLEYLALEPWADDVHLASSPVHGCTKTFFVPGFSPRTGGLLMDDELLALANTSPALARANLSPLLSDLSAFSAHRWVSVFSYACAPVAWLQNVLATSQQPTLCLLSAGLTTQAFEQALGIHLETGSAHTLGHITLLAMPFLPQPAFDRVLVACDLNIVRGEDSAVRAQLLGKPFLWQLYPQAENAHHEKLEAFLARFLTGCPSDIANNLRALFRVWNGAAPLHEHATIDALLASQPRQMQTLWPAHCARWQKTLIKQGSLANNLFHFCTGCV